ncbi:hypothetical protein [Maridesulfovibrio sp.]|uniref:hypothetical protein n=1 Tax=unclassified Maridesulfovibrio TaxID=2794999 RepID=UPI003B0070B2
MLKSIIMTTALMFFGLTNCFAADFGYAEDPKPAQTRITNDFSLSEIVNGLNLTETLKTELIFGLDKHHESAHDGPDATPSTMGVGLGFSFTF